MAERQAISVKGKVLGPRLKEINTLPPSDRTVYFLTSLSRHFITKIFFGF
jgi:hypothetical protein